MIKYNGYILADKIGKLCARQTGLFTPAHEKYYLYVTITTPEGVKNVLKTTYQFNPAAVKFENNDGLNAVLMDATAAADADNVGDFARLFGYNSTAAARRAFNGCRRAYAYFIKAGLTPADLNNILKLLENAD